MNLLDLYCSMQRKEITEEQAATVLGFSVPSLRFRVTKWGHRLPLLLATLDKIRDSNLSRAEAAKALGVSVRQVNHLMVNWNIERPIPEYLIENAAAQVKWEIRKKYAIEYIADSCTIEDAAENAGVSSRQIRRWVSELVSKHFGMTFKDLKEVTGHRRKRLADEIEVAEGLELAKQSVVRAISTGQKTVQDEALERVVIRRVNHKGQHVRRKPKPTPETHGPNAAGSI